MNNLQTHIKNYLEYCQYQKMLDKKTIKAYRIDLQQFRTKTKADSITDITTDTLENFIAALHQKYKPKTVKRKIASVKALFHYLEYKDVIARNPFNKIHVKFRNPVTLPKTIPLHTVEHFLSAIYTHLSEAKTDCQKKNSIRDIAVIELLFATGMRISELCSLKINDVNLYHDFTTFIDDTLAAELTVLRHSLLFWILCCFRYFSRKWHKIPAGEFVR